MVQPRPYHWYALLGAILLEVAGTTLMKASQNWTFSHAELVGVIVILLCVCLSYYMLALATTGLPIGVAYAVWESLGLTLVTLSSIFLLHETVSLKRIAGLCCVLSGAWFVHKGTTHGEET